MKAPEKLYFGESDKGILDIYSGRESNNEVEYTRTDTFIEKACNWLKNNSHNYANNALGKEYLVNDFKDYMKGE